MRGMPGRRHRLRGVATIDDQTHTLWVRYPSGRRGFHGNKARRLSRLRKKKPACSYGFRGMPKVRTG